MRTELTRKQYYWRRRSGKPENSVLGVNKKDRIRKSRRRREEK